MSTAVGKQFPDLNVDAMNEMGDTIKLNVLEEAVNNKKKVLLFWYPKDFTFVCPTELHAFQEALGEFEKRNTVVIGASCDTAEVHFAWLNTAKDNGGIEGVTYPILADSNRNLSSRLGILDIFNLNVSPISFIASTFKSGNFLPTNVAILLLFLKLIIFI